jgi:hypothetical protein
MMSLHTVMRSLSCEYGLISVGMEKASGHVFEALRVRVLGGMQY